MLCSAQPQLSRAGRPTGRYEHCSAAQAPQAAQALTLGAARLTANNTQLTRRNSEEETFFDKRIEKDSTFSANTEINTEDVSA